MISASTWKRVVRPLLPGPQEWAFKGKDTCQVPVDWVLLGVTAEGSGFIRDHVYVSVVCTPLFVPSEHVTLNHSWRVPNGTSPVAEAQLDATVRLALSQLPTQTETLRRIAASESEEGPYAALLLGHVRRARRRLAEPYWPKDDRPSVAEARHRRSVLLTALGRGGATEGIEVLRSWRNQTATALGLA